MVSELLIGSTARIVYNVLRISEGFKKIFKMIPANKIKEISNNIHSNYGDTDGLPPIEPLLRVLLIIGMLYIAVCYF